VAVVEPGEETTTQMDFEDQRDGPGTVGALKADDMNTGAEVDHSSRRRGRHGHLKYGRVEDEDELIGPTWYVRVPKLFKLDVCIGPA
jgi:hypothetical protein